MNTSTQGALNPHLVSVTSRMLHSIANKDSVVSSDLDRYIICDILLSMQCLNSKGGYGAGF